MQNHMKLLDKELLSKGWQYEWRTYTSSLYVFRYLDVSSSTKLIFQQLSNLIFLAWFSINIQYNIRYYLRFIYSICCWIFHVCIFKISTASVTWFQVLNFFSIIGLKQTVDLSEKAVIILHSLLIVHNTLIMLYMLHDYFGIFHIYLKNH